MKNLDHRRRQTMISGRKKNIPHSLPPLQNPVVSLNLYFHSALIKPSGAQKQSADSVWKEGNPKQFAVNQKISTKYDHCTVRN